MTGFDEAELTFLPDAERSELARLVAEFRQATSAVTPVAPATADAVQQARPAFRDIIGLLEFNR